MLYDQPASIVMQSALRVTFRHCDHSAALEARARDLIARLEHGHRNIVACHVVIEAPSAHHAKGGAFIVNVELSLPGTAIHASSTHGVQVGHHDAYVALRDAFENAKRQLNNLALAE